MCQMFCFYNNSFLFFGSGTPHRLLGLQKTKDAQENPQDLSNKKIQNVLGQDFLQRLWFFLFLCLTAGFLFLGPGSLHRLLGLGLQKNTGTPEEHQKNHKKNLNVCVQDLSFLLSLKFLLSFRFLFFWILMMFSSATRIAKKPKHFRKTKKNLEKQKTRGFSGMSGPRTFFRGFGFLVFWCFLSNSSFLVFGSGRFHHHRLLGL